MSELYFAQKNRSRRGFLTGALFVAGMAVAVAPMALRRRAFFARLGFDPKNFVLPAVANLFDASGAPVPGFSSADILGQAVFVHAFASWCPDCRAEHPALMEFSRAGGRIFGVATADNPAQTRDFLRSEGNPFARVGVDRRGNFYRALGARGIPASFVLAPAPHVALMLQGARSFGELQDKIPAALGGRA